MTTTAGPHRERRSIIGPAIFSAFMVALTLGLGIWQIERRAEKHALIAALDERLAAAPVPLPASSTWGGLTPSADEFRRVTLSTSAIASAQDATVYGSGSAVRTDVSGQGLWIFTPVRLPSGETVVIDRGFVSDADRERFAADASGVPPSGIVGYLRFPETGGWMMPAADHTKRLWFTRDINDMAQALGWGQVAPFYIDMEGPVPQSGLPKPGPLKPQLPDDHLQYAITWFGLSAAIAIAFLVWLRGSRKPALRD